MRRRRNGLRVAMIGQYGVPAAYGGVERVVEELGSALASNGAVVTVYCEKGSLPSERVYRGMQLRGAWSARGKHLAKLSLAFAATIHSLFSRYDVVHFHAIGPCLFIPLIRLLRPDITVCSTIHSRDDKFAKWRGLTRQFFRVAAWCATRLPHAVMTVSIQLQREMLRDFGVQATVVHNGIAPVGQHGDAHELIRWGLRPQRYLLTVGRLVHEKATDDLLKAFVKTSCDWSLVIVGDSAHTDDFADQVRDLARSDPRVILTGSVFGAPLDAIYRHAGAFVLASRLEGLPVVLLEAIAYSLPVIVSDIPANLEIVEDSGPGHRVFPVGDTAALSATIEHVVDNRIQEHAGAEMLHGRIAKEFSWSAAARITEKVYRSARMPQ